MYIGLLTLSVAILLNLIFVLLYQALYKFRLQGFLQDFTIWGGELKDRGGGSSLGVGGSG